MNQGIKTRGQMKMLLNYSRKFISKQLMKLGIVVLPKDVTEKDVLLIHNIRSQQLRSILLRDRLC